MYCKIDVLSTVGCTVDAEAWHASLHPVSVTRLSVSCFVDSLGPFVLLTCYHGGRFCRTDIVEDHKRLITINNYISQDWNDFNLAVRISSLRFSFGRDWNDKFQLRCSNDKFQLRCSNSTESDQSHARRPEDRTCHPVDRGRLRIPKHITNEMHEWVKTLGWGRIGSRWSRLACTLPPPPLWWPHPQSRPGAISVYGLT